MAVKASRRWPIRTGDFVLTAKAANHVLVGRIVSEADGKPVAKAIILRGGFQTRADENGRFRIEGLVSGKLELHASAAGNESETAPLGISIEIPETPLQIERTLTLPRGLVVTGRVVDGSSGNGVAKALVDFTPTYEAGQTPTGFGFSRETDPDGRFRLVVPPGRGTVVLQTFPVDFPQPERGFYGQPPNPSFARSRRPRRANCRGRRFQACPGA